MRGAFHPSIVTTFWPKIETAATAGTILSTEMVFREIQKQDDDLHEWCKSVDGMFKKMDQETIDKVAEIIRSHPKMIDPKKDKDAADPFLIAQASILRGTVVTQEDFSGGPHKLKIPDVCKAMGINCINMLTMIKEFGWTFK